MSAASLDLTLEQGATFTRKLTFKDQSNAAVDLTGQTFRGSIRRIATDTKVIAQFTFVLSNQTTNTGEVTMSLPAATSAGIKLTAQDSAVRSAELFAYDVERVFLDGSVERVLQGTIAISPEVTKE